MTTEDDFQRALDTNPDDWQTRLVFADWLEERGDIRAEGYRALGVLRLHPLTPRPKSVGWCSSSNLMYRGEAKWANCILPVCWYDATRALLTGVAGRTDKFWCERMTRTQAEDAAARAFAGLPDDLRAELLNPKLAGVT